MQFNKPNLDNIKKYLDENSNDGGTPIRWARIRDGFNVFRILPPWDPTGQVALLVNSHRIEYKMPNSNYTKYTWTCLQRTFGKKCNICEGLERIAASGVDVQNFLPEEVNYYVNALIVYDPAYDYAVKSGRSTEGLYEPGTHVLLRIPKTVHKWIVTSITNPMIGDITDVQSGVDVMIEKSGTGLATKYNTTLSPNGHQPIDPRILEKVELYNLSEIFSAGFNDDQVNGMIESLRTSGMNINNNVAGATVPQYPGYGNVPPGNSPYNVGNPYPQAPQYQQPMQNAAPQMPQYQQPQQSPAPAAPQYHQTPYNPQAPVGGSASLNVPVPNPYGYSQMQMNVPNSYTQQSAPQQQIPQQPMQSPAPQQQMPQQQMPQQQMPQQTAPFNPMQQPAQPQTQNLPKCFGSYNAQNVDCVVCPNEIECSAKR